MGTLSYGTWTVEFDDRLLTHLQIVIVNRFRRGESLLVSWIDSVTVGNGRSAVWMTPSVPVYFKFNGSRTPAIDSSWLDRLNASASSSSGLIVTDADGRPVHGTSAGAGQHPPRPGARGGIAHSAS